MRELSHDFADATAGVLEAHGIHNYLAMVTDAIVCDAPSPLARATEFVVPRFGRCLKPASFNLPVFRSNAHT